MAETARHNIAVAMSGGVDSTVCAALLRRQYAVHGFFMDIGLPDREAQLAQVRAIAAQLAVPLEVIDLRQAFHAEVIGYFRRSYLAGRTPNPCVVCNPRIKFGRLLDEVRRRGMEKMATGHYVRLRRDSEGIHLFTGSDPKKDQSYFLCGVSEPQLAHLLFPLGDLTKEKVCRLAIDLGFRQFAEGGSESQDACFLQGRGVGDFLKDETEGQKGDIVSTTGERLGRHAGLFHYTVGQRRGLGICDATPSYVIGLDPTTRHVIVGKELDLWRRELRVTDMSWIAGAPAALPLACRVRIRSRHAAAEAELVRDGDGWRILFQAPQRAVTPGQFAVVYRGDEVLGGGEIAG
ncbi:MAG: tRNA 2-thiouridine(34) synthase MnmA [Thermodesulfobacteriota bacterium]